ncbi:MAG: DUF711 family protein [Pyrobaculum sp.]
MKIRSLTLHVTHDYNVDLVEKFLQVAEMAGPLTIRVSISPPPKSAAAQTIEKLKNLGVKYISALHLQYNSEEMYRYIAEYQVFGTFNDALEYVKFLKLLHQRGEVHLSRYVSLVVGRAVYNSPYFPASISTKTGVSIALLYPNDVNQIEDIEHFLKIGEEIGRRVANSIGVEFIGVDGSLSPWGEDSVAKTIERLYGIKLGQWGSRHAIAEINNAIWNSSVLKTGFNEVMLPLAEDEELKRLVKSGLLDLEKLVGYVAVCVPGLDMVPLKINSWKSLKLLLYDLAALAERKQKAVGVRIFPVDVDEYYVEGFGKTPALELK